MSLVIADFGHGAGGWRVDRHPRFLADLTGAGRADIVGFGETGVWVSLGNGDGTFAAPSLVLENFAHDTGWRVDRHPRFLADLTGAGRADIVGFGEVGVFVSLGNGDGTFSAPSLVLENFAHETGWRVNRHPRFLADLTGAGRADIVGFGEVGVFVSLGNGDGTFSAPSLVLENFAHETGWRVDRHPRFLADLTGAGRADIVGFGETGVWVSLGNGDGTFSAPSLVLENFAHETGWRVDRHPRFLADLTGAGRADIVGFGETGVWVSLGNGDGTFAAPSLVLENFAHETGWRVDRHPRFLADLTGAGRPDIVGFGETGVWVSLGNGDGTFAAPSLVLGNFARQQGWRVDRHPRQLADLDGDGCADIVGFGEVGVWVSLNNGDGTFPGETVHVRRDVWTLQADAPWDPVTEAFARAVAVMQARPASDPTSWTYQAAIHASHAPVPAGASWNECQHQSWYFLAWHRMYVYFFERIVRDAVVGAGGPSDFALPYWNYDEPFPANTLPQPFREPTLPDGTSNPLFLPPPRRNDAVADGFQLSPLVTSSSAAMAMTSFTGPPGPGFGGGRRTPAHFGGSVGGLEQTPHNDIHVTIGGVPSGECEGGLMIDPRCAALDPIFWLHHANVDRLWDRWLALGGGRANPTDAAWLDQSFNFHDETGAVVSLTGAEIVDTSAQLQYAYDDQVPTQAPRTPMSTPPPGPDHAARPPEMAAATEQSVELTGDPVSVVLAVPRSTRSLVSSERMAAGAGEVYLNVEDIEAEQNPGLVYGVFLNLPPDNITADRGRHHVGNISLFGIETMNDPDQSHEGVPGFRHTFGITGVVAALSEAGEWDPDAISVTFEPIIPLPPPGEEERMAAASAQMRAAAATRPVRIGRVSLFVA